MKKIDFGSGRTEHATAMPILLSASAILAEKPVIALKIFPVSTTRTPKHLVLLIDTSGSMEGERMKAVKRTLHLLVDEMASGDRLTLIRYSSESTIPIEAVLTPDRSAVHLAVDNLVADGGTNLEKGLLHLKDLISRSSSNVDSVFLLTDGHFNEGLSKASGLLRILGSNIPPLNTLGFGTDYNIRTLKHLSVATRGSHTFADSAELIPAIIGDIVGGMSSMFARASALRIPPGWRCLELGDLEGDTYNVGTLVAEKAQWVLLEGEVVPEHLVFTYDGITTQVPIDASIPEMDIYEQLARTHVMTVFGKVTDILEYRTNAEAIQAAFTTLQGLLRLLEASPAASQPFVVRLMAQVDEMLDEVKRPYNLSLAPRMASNQVTMGQIASCLAVLRNAWPVARCQHITRNKTLKKSKPARSLNLAHIGMSKRKIHASYHVSCGKNT